MLSGQWKCLASAFYLHVLSVPSLVFAPTGSTSIHDVYRANRSRQLATQASTSLYTDCPCIAQQHVGRINEISPSPTYTLTIGEASEILQDCAIGDSICVNGACLTVTEFDASKGWFKVGLGVCCLLSGLLDWKG